METKTAAARLVSLDAFRGATIAAMILVNTPGSWSTTYWPLLHASWHGWTPTDLIFPFFLFIVGVAMNFSRKSSLREALRRTLILAGLGLFSAAYPRFDLPNLRLPGVLQRIAVCYLVAWVIRHLTGPKGQALAAAVCLGGYWALMTLVPVPGGIAPNLDPATNLAAWLDNTLLNGHMWAVSKTWDPEGVLSTIPAIATTLLGLLAGEWLRSDRSMPAKAKGLLTGGLVLTVLGLLWGESFPINKPLWTSSYVLLTGGLAAYALGLTYWIVDVRGRKGWTFPFTVFGTNAILVYVGSGILTRTLLAIKLAGPDGLPVTLYSSLHRVLFASWLPPYDASLGFALATVAFWFLVALVLHRKRIYLKV
jgi:predicted acyltransferase